MKLVWVPRSVWGSLPSTEVYIRDRVADPAAGKTEIHVHHSAAIDDDDSTPNRWDYAEAVAYMRRLQWVRPELGPLPYSENYAASEDLGTVWVFQGRGWVKRGAHTGGHNVAGVGLAAFGNFNHVDSGAAAVIVEAMEQRVAWNRTWLLPNLGSKKSPKGWNAWGHRDSKATSCPGGSLYSQLSDFDLEGDNNMAHPAENFAEFVKEHDIGRVPTWSPWERYVDARGSSIPASGTWAYTRADIAWFWQKFVVPLQSTNRNLLSRVKILESKVDALATGAGDAAAMARANKAHDRLDAAKAAM